jgi:hypothetical protein
MKKENNRHSIGLGNGTLGKKQLRIKRAAERPQRSIEKRMQSAGTREKEANGWP